MENCVKTEILFISVTQGKLGHFDQESMPGPF